jgi:hypothetical protein
MGHDADALERTLTLLHGIYLKPCSGLLTRLLSGFFWWLGGCGAKPAHSPFPPSLAKLLPAALAPLMGLSKIVIAKFRPTARTDQVVLRRSPQTVIAAHGALEHYVRHSLKK